MMFVRISLIAPEEVDQQVWVLGSVPRNIVGQREVRGLTKRLLVRSHVAVNVLPRERFHRRGISYRTDRRQ
jgi:hypothetical protein